MANICTNCNSSKICKILEFLKNNSDTVNVTINSCCINKGETSLESVDAAEVINQIKAPRTYSNFRDESNKMNASKKIPIRNISIVKEDIQQNKNKIVKCEVCGGITYEEDIKTCVKCEKNTCSNCGTESAETKERFCNDCWKTII